MRKEIDCDVEMRVISEEDTGNDRSDRRTRDRSGTDASSAALWLKAEDRTWPLRSVRVLDVSPGGLSFETDAPLPVGAHLEMNLNTPLKNGIIAVAEVRYAAPLAEGYRVGVKFTQISLADRRLLDKRNFREEPMHRPRRQTRKRSGERWWEWQNKPY